ncbi:hypothetical protein [Acanthopleuribacter pedis]|uniref:Uncharacterized protein n=1 Tax=Acanthopleuribacter pedis TaxID=442870 RepID=A0A8J7QBB8_9BACT|nr:hypothetical protein [Acanthopleuribacter pedis]MBO1320539.1 hypothetical protein [Acanthopleuribacter pedis]
MKIKKILIALALVFCFVGAAQATCIDVLNRCYSLNGSELLCNTLYADCIRPA